MIGLSCYSICVLLALLSHQVIGNSELHSLLKLIGGNVNSDNDNNLNEFASAAIIDGHKFGTATVHAGCELDSIGTVVPPITLSTTFAQSFPGKKPGIDDVNSHGTGFFYSRQANPTRGALERALFKLEQAKHCCVFGSGLAATSAVIHLLNSGDRVLALNDLYGGTTSYFRDVASSTHGIKFDFIDMSDLSVVEASIKSDTKLIWLETPTNPLLKTTDIAAIVAIAKKYNLLVAVDSTFMSPYLQNALSIGADIVVHSVTKYIAGHSDVLMGAVLANRDDIIKRLKVIQEKVGAVPSPFECYLALRGLKTLKIRMDVAQSNAQAIAELLEKHPMVEKVVYPGLKSYEQYDIARRQTRGPGAMIAMYIKGGLPIAGRFLQELKIFELAVSLGAVESLACSPAIMTHGAVPKEDREKIGLTDSLIRLSVGIEDQGDLLVDLKQALDTVQKEFEQQQ